MVRLASETRAGQRSLRQDRGRDRAGDQPPGESIVHRLCRGNDRSLPQEIRTPPRRASVRRPSGLDAFLGAADHHPAAAEGAQLSRTRFWESASSAPSATSTHSISGRRTTTGNSPSFSRSIRFGVDAADRPQYDDASGADQSPTARRPAISGANSPVFWRRGKRFPSMKSYHSPAAPRPGPSATAAAAQVRKSSRRPPSRVAKRAIAKKDFRGRPSDGCHARNPAVVQTPPARRGATTA